jgi:hypothetical protein
MAAAATLSGLLLFAGGPPDVFAAGMGNDEVVYRSGGADASFDRYQGNVKIYGDVQDLFGEVTKDLMPGSIRNFDVQFRNYVDKNVTFYLKAEALTGGGAKNLENVDRFEGYTAMDELLEHVRITIEHAGNIIYSGSLDGPGSPALYTGSGVVLGTLAPGTQGTLDITLSVSKSLRNQFFNSLCAVNWIFSAWEDEQAAPVTTEPTDVVTEPAVVTTEPTAGTTTEPADDVTTTEPAVVTTETADDVTTEPAGVTTTEPAAGNTETPTQPEDSAITEPTATSIDMSDDPPAVPPTSPNSPGSISDSPVEDISPEETPLGAVTDASEDTDPELLVVVDPDTIPLSLPLTGGTPAYATSTALALVALIGMCAATVIKKRREEGSES